MKYFIGFIMGTVFGVILLWYTTVPPVINHACIVAPTVLKAPVRYIFDCTYTVRVPEDKSKGFCYERREFPSLTNF
jgi:hypothetical protein